VQENILPYKKPDGHQTPADKKHAHRFKYAKGEKNISSKTQQKVALLAKQCKYTSASRRANKKVNNNRIAVYSAQRNRHRIIPKKKS
jgi:hypothetical protein